MTNTENNFGLIKITGADAAKFLQGQLTCDVLALTPGQFSLSAHCNPQGRVVSLFYVIYINDAYYLALPPNMLTLTQEALKKYAIFYKLTITDATNELPQVLQQIGNPALFDTQSGIPRIHPETSGAFLPHDINLDQLNAISFNKGCYTGQEIVARMQYRGKLKKRMRLTTLAEAPALGTDHSLGVIVDTKKQNDLYLILYITHVKEAE